jgi:hypothetical protein
MHERDKAMSVGARRGEPLRAALEAVVMRCLAKRPLDRYADCAELYAALEQVSVGPWTSQDARTGWGMPRLAGTAATDEPDAAGGAPERAS